MGLLAYAAVSAAISIGGAIYSSSQQKEEARRAEQYAQYNAEAQQQWGEEQAWMSMYAAQYNATSMIKQAKLNASVATDALEYNVAVLRNTALYNSMLYDAEIDSMYNASELSRDMAHIEAAKAQGSTIVRQGASNTVIGEGSNADVIIDMKATEALVDLALETDAKNRAAELLNAKAQGDWQTEMAVVQQTYETQLQNYAMIENANASANGTMINGAMNAWAAKRGAGNQAQSMLWAGEQQSASLQAQAQNTLVQGFGSAANTMAGAGYKGSLLTS